MVNLWQLRSNDQEKLKEKIERCTNWCKGQMPGQVKVEDVRKRHCGGFGGDQRAQTGSSCISW